MTFKTLFPKLKRLGFVTMPSREEIIALRHPEGAVLLINKLPLETEVGRSLRIHIETLMAVYGIGNGKPLWPRENH